MFEESWLEVEDVTKESNTVLLPKYSDLPANKIYATPDKRLVVLVYTCNRNDPPHNNLVILTFNRCLELAEVIEICKCLCVTDVVIGKSDITPDGTVTILYTKCGIFGELHSVFPHSE